MSPSRLAIFVSAAALSASAFAATTWNGATGNWVAGDATIWDSAFANGDNVTFGGTTAGTITVDAGGVSPTSTTVGNTGGTTFTGGPIGGTLTETAGTLTLTGANNFTSTALNGGRIIASNTAALGTGAITVGTGALSATSESGLGGSGSAGSFLYLSGLTGSQTFANDITLASDSTTTYRKIAVAGSASTTYGANSYNFSGLISGGGAGTILYFDSATGSDGYSVVRLSNSSNSFTGTVQFNRASLQIDSDTVLGASSNRVVMNAFTWSKLIFNYSGNYTHATALSTSTNLDVGTNNIVASGVFSGNTLTKLGTGTLTMSANNTLSGVVVAAGKLTLTGANATTNVTVAGGTLLLDATAGIAPVGGTLTLGAAGTIDSSALLNGSAIAKAITLSGTGTSTLYQVAGTGTNGVGVNYSGIISGTTATLYMNTGTGNATGTFTLSGANTFTATSTVTVNRGQLVIANATALGASTNTLKYDSYSGTLGFAGSYTIANNINFTFASQNVDTGANNVTLNGVIGGNQQLTKIGSGALTLGGLATNTGKMVVSVGSLTVASTGGLRINGASGINIASGASLAVAGTLVATGITDTIANAGALSGSGVLKLGTAFDSWTGGSYQLITGTGSNTLALTVDTTGSASWSSVAYNNGVLTFTAVPEPSAYGLLGAGVLAGVAMVRRRRRA